MARSALAVALALALVATPAAAFRAVNGMQVIQTGPQTFEVPFGRYAQDSQFWCAAGDFVRRGLGLPNRTPIFLTDPPPRKAGQGMRFQLFPEGASPRTGITVFNNQGPANSVSATIAYSRCQVRIPVFGDF